MATKLTMKINHQRAERQSDVPCGDQSPGGVVDSPWALILPIVLNRRSKFTWMLVTPFSLFLNDK